MPRAHDDWEQAFWLKVHDTGDCWVWTGSLMGGGYGQFGSRSGGCRRGKTTAAHRIAYELVVGLIPVGLTIDHLCRNRACVNPAHMEPVTLRENVLRGISPTSVNASKEYCVHGHPLAGANLYVHSGTRHCRICRNRRSREFQERRAIAAL